MICDAPGASDACPVTAHRGEEACPPPTSNIPTEGDQLHPPTLGTSDKAKISSETEGSDTVCSNTVINQPILNDAELANLLENCCSLRD